MNPLEESIAQYNNYGKNWKLGDPIRLINNPCVLCHYFCHACPVKMETGYSFCDETPYVQLCEHIIKFHEQQSRKDYVYTILCEDCIKLIEKEKEFLIDIAKKYVWIDGKFIKKNCLSRPAVLSPKFVFPKSAGRNFFKKLQNLFKEEK